ncbi:cAMP-binding domain of CRP or a regulatory subunit of cAMP-dependent protein kinases [Pedobacter westerhofensis]|uniref:cAMP-binding domain of CRP or a regulatory subunit of cAMP-dependent protein kinases n=1 Tax=Pedobacter westerhofensis TaxID=425512 RepID=A0A521FTW9_9SPHI|nr:Crp/Fnr family transcriptional regulator [Pedobacter westerhofensis]SMO99020.1 cAMP-binding domain of CRP or a regulatory subunit of cAMP-dependent protein kinases [Pedobacter westerhofensis]
MTTGKEKLADHIRNVTYLTDEQLELVLDYFKPSSHLRNEVLVEIGQVNDHMNFVVKGCVRIFFVRDDGLDMTRNITFENQFATGLASFISQNPSMEALQVLEDTQLLRISRKDFYYLLNLIGAWEKFFRKYLEYAYLNNLSIYHREIMKDAAERYKELLTMNPEIVKRLPNKIVASYLNMSPETLSRMKSKT